MRLFASLLMLILAIFPSYAYIDKDTNIKERMTMNQKDTNEIASLDSVSAKFPLKLSLDKLYLVDQEERPFLVIGDSPWSLIVQPTPDQLDLYLDDRQAKGFTLLLVNLIEHKFSSNPPQMCDGRSPFNTPGDFATPNDDYFVYAEEVARKAEKRGIVILLCPAYLGFGGGDQGFYQEMLQNGPEKIRAYGRYVGERFRDHLNLIWIMGGDFNPPLENRWVVNELAAGIREEDSIHLMTAHCGPNGVATNIYGDQSWLQLNNVYDYRMELYVPCLAEDARLPRMPYFLLETAYEGEHKSTPDRIRRQAYWPLLCGAFGQVYGNSPIWHFGSVGVYDQGGDWLAALDSQGARYMACLATLFHSIPWWLLRVDHENQVVKAGGGTFGQADYVTTARTSDGTYALSYIPSTGTEPREISLDLSQFIGMVTARWFNPVKGSYTHIPDSPFPNTGIQVFTTPGDNGTGTNDWLLLLEAK